MFGNLFISGALSFKKRGAPVNFGGFQNVAASCGERALEFIQEIGPQDLSLNIESLTNGPGMLMISPLEVVTPSAIPAAPIISAINHNGAAGSTNYEYAIVGRLADGSYSAPSTALSSSTGNATLDGTNNNELTWNDIDLFDSIDVYRTVSAGTPSSLGFIGNFLAGESVIDSGLAGDGNAAPSTGIAPVRPVLKIGSAAAAYPFIARLNEPLLTRWNRSEIHLIAATPILAQISVIEKAPG